MPRVVYRIIVNNPPTDDDYLTYEQRGVSVDPRDAEKLRMSQGLSIFLQISTARHRGKGFPWKGTGFIATYEIPDDESVVIERTGTKPGHYTLWCDESVLRNGLRKIEPIRRDNENV